MTTFKAKVTVMPHTEILDPQGKAVEQALNQMGIESVDKVRIGKNIEFRIEAASKEDAEKQVDHAAKSLLSNPIMEFYEIKIESE